MKAAKQAVFFILFELIFCSIYSIVLVFYGPFTNIRDTFVTSAMATMHHKYLATLFLSRDEINSILAKNKDGIITEKENQNDVVVSSNKSDDISIKDVSTNRFKGKLMIISNPSRVSVATSDNINHGGMTVSEIVKNHNALAGINAGGFNDATGTSNGSNPSGIIIENYNVKFASNSDSYSIVGFNSKNVLVIGNFTREQIDNMNIRDAVSFGPPLVINGKPMIVKGNGGWGIQPRTVIGQRKDGTVLFLVVDGRQKDSLGATLKDVQDIMLDNGAYNASNLDGGASTTMYYNGQVINKPSDILGERSVPSAFVVK